MKKIEAKIIADSLNEFGNRITSFIVTMPRFLLAELNTHRAFSRNSASSRAVPFNKMVEMVENDPFIPTVWQEDHSGMQGTQYLDDKPASYLNPKWTDQLKGRDILNSIWGEKQVITKEDGTKIYPIERPQGSALYHAIECAKELNANKATKQLANRLLESFMWHVCIITATDFENFFKLRCPSYELDWGRLEKTYVRSRKDYRKARLDAGSTQEYFDSVNRGLDSLTELDWLRLNKGQAEIHMMALAEAIWDEINSSTPKKLKAGEWHIPDLSKMKTD